MTQVMHIKMKSVATAMLAGAFFAASTADTHAGKAVPSTNDVVLEDVSIALKVYSQGLLAGHVKNGVTNETSLKANVSSLTTADILQQLAIVSEAFTYASGDKLVQAHFYTNDFYGILGSTVSSSLLENISLAGGTNLYIETLAGSNSLVAAPFVTSFATNSFLISNSIVYNSSNPSNLTVLTHITSGQIFAGTNNSSSNDTVVSTVNYTLYPAYTNSGHYTGAWATLVPTVTSNATNVTITQYSPELVDVYTNGVSEYGVLTPASHGTPATLVPVQRWFSLSASLAVYAETGTNLLGNDFSGSNIKTQTAYGTAYLALHTYYPTNNQPAASTNLSITASGYGSVTANLQNLTVAGTNKNIFQIEGDAAATVSGTGWLGGVYTTNVLQTNTFNGVTTTNATLDIGGYLGTNYLVARFAETTNILVQGTVAKTYLTTMTNLLVNSNLLAQPSAVEK